MYTLLDSKTKIKEEFFPSVNAIFRETRHKSIYDIVQYNMNQWLSNDIQSAPQNYKLFFIDQSYRYIPKYSTPIEKSIFTSKLEIQQDFNDLLNSFLDDEYIRINFNLDVIEKDDYETLLIVKYKNIEQVEAIYIDEYLEEKNITILLSIKQYDDKLMETLIHKELDISKIFPDVIASYNYIPDLIDNRYDIISEKSKLIFEK